MHDGLMTGMMWAGIVLIGVPLAIGIGVAVFLVRRGRAASAGSASEARGGESRPADR